MFSALELSVGNIWPTETHTNDLHVFLEVGNRLSLMSVDNKTTKVIIIVIIRFLINKLTHVMQCAIQVL